MNDIAQKIIAWQQDCPNGPWYNDIDAFIRFRSQTSFCQYQPTAGPHPDFCQRLTTWLNSITDKDAQRRLFELVPRLYFFGKEEFDSLFRAAHQEIVIHWLIDLYGIDITSANAESLLQAAIRETFFCSVTDSGRIGDYFHINALGGQSDRPAWLTWARYGKDAIKAMLEGHKAKQVVMIEDFIGTGSQFLGKDVAVDSPMIASLKITGSAYPTLILPLVACKAGIDNINNELRKNKCVWAQCKAVFTLGERCFISERYDHSIFSKMSPDEIEFFLAIHDIVKKAGGCAPFECGPFGYGFAPGEGMGSLVVLYTNCSDNTLAIIHEETGTWKPLFPRRPREAV